MSKVVSNTELIKDLFNDGVLGDEGMAFYQRQGYQIIVRNNCVDEVIPPQDGAAGRFTVSARKIMGELEELC